MRDKFVRDIQLIAKTKELEDLVKTALQTSEEIKKETIATVRILASQLGTNTKSVDTGSNSNDVIQTFVGADGLPLNVPEYHGYIPPTSSTNTTTAGNIANFSSYTGNNNLASNFNNAALNDLTARANSAGIGGSLAHDQATVGTSNADVQLVKDTMAAIGFSDSAIATQVMQMTNFESGVHEVSNLYNGLTGPKPSNNIQNNYDNAGNSTISNDVVKAITGIDPNNPDLSMIVRLDGKQTPPTLADSELLNQRWYDEANGVDTTWQLGHRVTDNGTGVHYYSGSDWFGNEPTIQTLKISFTDLVLHFNAGVPQWEANSVLAGGTLRTAGQSSCTPGVDTACLITSPTLVSWPKTANYLLKLINGVFQPSAKDSEVPLSAQQPSSYVRITSAINSHTYVVEPAINGGTNLYDESDPAYMLHYGSDGSLQAIVAPDQFNFYRPYAR